MRILFCPLNWGLGHGTRDIPIIRLLLNLGCEVLIAAGGRTYDLLKKEFPSLVFIHFPDYNAKYSSLLPAVVSVFLQTPKIIFGIIKEHFAIKRLIEAHRINAVVSDNRYGLFNHKVPSVFISHQILIKPPKLFSFIEVWLWLLSASMAQKFSFSWIPDVGSGINLSGDLSHKYPLPDNGRFIGPLADIDGEQNPLPCDILVLVSGPEAARADFESLILRQLTDLADLRIIVLLGKPEGPGLSEKLTYPSRHIVYEHLERKQLSRYLEGAEIVVSRPGYTTVMEVAHLGKKAVWVPTPGQTEQEYLAEYYSEMGYFAWVGQKDFSLKEIWKRRNEVRAINIRANRQELSAALNEFMEKVKSEQG